MGKELSKISLPVYLNEPTSILQKPAQSMEYEHILREATAEQRPFRRIALIAIFWASSLTQMEKNVYKPFNPLLGETYEFVTNDFEYLAE